MISFKDGFKRARKSTGLSQEKFAEKFGFSLPSVKKWEQGKAVPEADTLAFLCEIFECDMSYLFYQIELPTHDLQFIHEQTGLTKEAIQSLVSLKAKNSSTGYTDVLSTIIEDEDFIYLLALIAGKFSENDERKIDTTSGNARIIEKLSDITDFAISKTISNITDRARPKYLEKYLSVDQRLDMTYCQMIEGLRAEGRITPEQYNEMMKQYGNGGKNG